MDQMEEREHNTSYVTQRLGYVTQHPGKNSESGISGNCPQNPPPK